MTQINPNINQYNNNLRLQQQQAMQQQAVSQPSVQQPVPQQPVNIPSYYSVSDDGTAPKNIKEFVKQADPMGILSPFFEHPLLVLTAWLGMGLGIDAYSKACGGEYEKSLVKKAANLGDAIQESKLIQNKPMQAVIGGLKSVKKAAAKGVQHSGILRAMRDTPSMPEWSLVKTQMFNQKQEVVQDFIRISDTLKLNDSKPIELKDIGLTSAEKDMLKKHFNVKKISEISENNAVSQILLKRLGRTQEQIDKIIALGDGSVAATKQEILKEMGLTADKIKLIKEDVYGKYINDVKVATGKVRGKVKMGTGHYKWMGPVTKLFERTIGCDEVYNKLHSMSDGAKTGTGRFMSKALQMMHRGLTFGGGKLGALIFIAPLLVEVGVNVKKADKDQKVGTAIGGLVESTSWVLTFPLALKLMHKLGGAQYAGMGKEKVEQFRKVLEGFNEKVKSGALADKEAYIAAKKEAKVKMKELSKVEGQNILTKGVRNLARFLTIDLETFKGRQTSNIVANKMRQIPNFFKNVAGIPMRFAVWGLICMGVLDSIIKKGVTTVFGKSYDAMKEDEHETAKKEQKKFLAEDLNRRLYEAQRNKQYGNAPAQAEQNPQGQMLAARARSLNSDAIPQLENQVDNYSYIPSSKNVINKKPQNNKVDNYTYIPSSECKIQSDKQKENTQRSYIPSQAAANIQKNFDNSGLQSALDRAQKAEDKALKVLAGNFDGM